MPAGRPSDYTTEIAAEICKRVALGESILAICRDDEHMPDRSTVYVWLEKHEEFQDQLQRARTVRADSRSDRIDDWASQVAAGKLKPNAAKVIIDAEKWQAGRENPKRYGDRAAIEHTGKDGKDLIPETDSTELARRVAFILSTAKT